MINGKLIYELKNKSEFKLEPRYLITDGRHILLTRDENSDARVNVCIGTLEDMMDTYKVLHSTDNSIGQEVYDIMRWVLLIDDEFRINYMETMDKYFEITDETDYYENRAEIDNKKFSESLIYCLLKDEMYGSHYLKHIINKVVLVLNNETLEMPKFRYGDFELYSVIPEVVKFIKSEEGCICRLSEECANLESYFDRVKDYIKYAYNKTPRTDLEINVMELTLDYIGKAFSKYTIE
ncbi:hypothetical protein UT300012_23580 [Paraclostridium bifermentans]